MQGDVRMFSFEILFMSLFSLMKEIVSSSLNSYCDQFQETSVYFSHSISEEKREGLHLYSLSCQERGTGEPPSQT